LKTLKLKIRKLDDGRFYVRYYWRLLEPIHRQYFDSIKELNEFLLAIVENTKWEA